MDRKVMMTAFVFGAAAAAVWAQGTGQNVDPVDHELKMMDTDGDGKVSAEEHATGVRRMFESMDADHDGKVTAAEMDEAHARMAGGKPAAGEMSAAEKIKVLDTDGDGALSAAEHTSGAKGMFERQDADKDGFLSREELVAGRALKMKR